MAASSPPSINRPGKPSRWSRRSQDFTYILKRELTFIPLFGQYLVRSNQIAIDRKSRSAALSDLIAAGGRGDRRGTRDLHLSGRHAPSGRRAAALQERRQPSLCRRPGALRSGRAEFRPVLAAPHVSASPGNHRGRISAGDPGRAAQGANSPGFCRRGSKPPPTGLIAEALAKDPGLAVNLEKNPDPRPPRRIDFIPVLFFLCLRHVSSSKDRT